MSRDYGTHKVPMPFEDEDKWFLLTKRQIAVVTPVLLFCGWLLIQTFKLHMLPIGIIVSVFLIILAGAFVLVKVPKEKYLFGSGLKLETVAFRILKKKLPWNKVIYTKYHDNKYEEW